MLGFDTRLRPADPNTPLWSFTAVYADGRMIEETFGVPNKIAGVQIMMASHPDAVSVDGEFVMTLGQFLGR